MARVKAFIEASNEHRQVAIGGRRRNRRVSASLNTDNGYSRDCGMEVDALVTDTLEIDETRFSVRLPGYSEGWTCDVTLPGVDYVHPSRVQRAMFDVYEKQYEHLSHVQLPGWVSLSQAMACMAYCHAHGITSLEEADDREPVSIDKKRRAIRRGE